MDDEHPTQGSGQYPTPGEGSPMAGGGYPVRFSVDYPDRPLDRLTSALRAANGRARRYAKCSRASRQLAAGN
jgi:hypothetical protein